MRRVLRDGGSAVVAVWQGLDRHPLYEALADAEVPHLGKLGVQLSREEVAASFSFGDADELRALLYDAGFGTVDLTAQSIEARFATPDRFIERMAHAYAAVAPQFAEDSAAFADYVDAVSRDTKPIVEQYRVGELIVVPMHSHVAVAHTPAPAEGRRRNREGCRRWHHGWHDSKDRHLPAGEAQDGR